MAEQAVGIYRPCGVLIRASVCTCRKQARRTLARRYGVAWGDLWRLGYRVGTVPRKYPTTQAQARGGR